MKSMYADKQNRLTALLHQISPLAVAFSGGVDSSFLIAFAQEILGHGGVTAITAAAPIFTEEEQSRAVNFAKQRQIRHIIVNVDMMGIPEFVASPPNRCYLCKQVVLKEVIAAAHRVDIEFVADGSNCDDVNDYRPGSAAVRELGVRSPLLECGWTKQDVRRGSRELDLPTASLESSACLATRFPFGHEITPARLKQVAQAETELRALNLKHVRVRASGDTARIEIAQDSISLAASDPLRTKIINIITRNGFRYATLDLCGYKTGSWNQQL